MTDAELTVAYSGKIHESFYRYRVEEYGGVYFEEAYHADGTLDYRAGELTLTGFWRVANGRICFEYPATPLNSGCFVVVFEDGCYYSYQTNDSGEPEGLAEGRWWIRAKIKGTNPDCAAADLVS
jgi:hypothetical protein